jgi:hypothetical protein
VRAANICAKNQIAYGWVFQPVKWLNASFGKENEMVTRKRTPDGIIRYYDSDGLLHNAGDEPAEIWPVGGCKKWYKHGKLHRDGDKPAVESIDRNLALYYRNGELHRDAAPAVINGSVRYWYQYGKRHNENGYAEEWENGYTAYWLNDECYNEADYIAEIKKLRSKPITHNNLCLDLGGLE